MGKKLRCYIYTRVSTKLQVDGFSLDAQREAAKRYADAYDMQIVGEYSDEGKSGKNILGRSEFARMLDDVKAQKDNVDFVLVFKLSRFGRNAADVLTSLQLLEDYGVNLVCVDDGIDSSKDAGKLLISVLSAVAELERENIRSQTMAGREQKAREGRWNGGFAPYGYKLIDGKLEIAEDEVEVIRSIFEKYTTTTWRGQKIADYLNDHFQKKIRQNGSSVIFSPNFVKKVLDNPVYMGKISYGRRRTEKIKGSHNEYKIVAQQEFPIYDGIHVPIVSEEVWYAAHEKRKEMGKTNIRKHHLEHEHLLSCILRCPICGASMYGNTNIKKKKNGKDGEYHEYYYQCKHRRVVDGKKCWYNRQWSESHIDEAVEEVISRVVTSDKFKAELGKKIKTDTSISEALKDLDVVRKKIRNKNSAKDRVCTQIDGLDYDNPMSEEIYNDLQNRLDSIYQDIKILKEEEQAIEAKKRALETSLLTADNIYTILLNFNTFFDSMSEKDKKLFISNFVEKVEIFEEKQSDGRIIKSIKFKFPIPYDGEEVQEIRWDNQPTVETVVLLNRESKS